LAIFTLFIYFLEKPFPDTYIIIATTIARAISSVINYTLNKKVVFQEEEQIRGAFIRYVLLSIIQMLLSGLLVTVIVKTVLPYELVTKILVDCSLFFLAFFVQKKFIFTSK